MAKWRKKAIKVTAEVLTNQQYVTTLEGVSEGKPGDYLVTGVDSEQWVVKPKWFKGAYKHISGNTYQRIPQVLEANAIDEPEVIQAPTGPIKGDKGDYKITGTKGEHWFVKPDIFAKTYERVKDNMKKSMMGPLNPAIHQMCCQIGADAVTRALGINIMHSPDQGYHLPTDGPTNLEEQNSGTGNGTTASQVEHYIDMKNVYSSPFSDER
jgi:hypothetical protein